MKISSTFAASNGQSLSVELTEEDFTHGELDGLNLPERHKKMSQMADLMMIKRFKDTGVWPEDFSNQLAANAVK